MPCSASATRQHSSRLAGAPGSRSKTSAVGRCVRLGAGERRVQFDRREVCQPHAASAGPARARSRSACCPPAGATVRTQSGRWAGACFWKKDLPSTPSGQRVRSARGPAGGRAGRRERRVVVDQVALGEAGSRIEQLVEVGELQLAPSRRSAFAAWQRLPAPRGASSLRSAGSPRALACGAGRAVLAHAPRLRVLVLAQPLVARVAQAAGARSTRRTRPRRRAAARRRRAARRRARAGGEGGALARAAARAAGEALELASLKPLPTRPT